NQEVLFVVYTSRDPQAEHELGSDVEGEHEQHDDLIAGPRARRSVTSMHYVCILDATRSGPIVACLVPVRGFGNWSREVHVGLQAILACDLKLAVHLADESANHAQAKGLRLLPLEVLVPANAIV